MPSIHIDPNQPLSINATFDTPLRIHVEFQYRAKGASTWTTFYTSNVSADSPSQTIAATLTPKPPAPQPAVESVLLSAAFAGAKSTPYQGRIAFSQNGQTVGSPITWNDSTGGDMAKFEQVQVDLT